MTRRIGVRETRGGTRNDTARGWCIGAGKQEGRMGNDTARGWWIGDAPETPHAMHEEFFFFFYSFLYYFYYCIIRTMPPLHLCEGAI